MERLKKATGDQEKAIKLGMKHLRVACEFMEIVDRSKLLEAFVAGYMAAKEKE